MLFPTEQYDPMGRDYVPQLQNNVINFVVKT